MEPNTQGQQQNRPNQGQQRQSGQGNGEREGQQLGERTLQSTAEVAIRGAAMLWDLQMETARNLMRTQARTAAMLGIPDYSDFLRVGDEHARRIISLGAEQVLNSARQARETLVEIQRHMGRLAEQQVSGLTEEVRNQIEQAGRHTEERLQDFRQLAVSQTQQVSDAARQMRDAARQGNEIGTQQQQRQQQQPQQQQPHQAGEQGRDGDQPQAENGEDGPEDRQIEGGIILLASDEPVNAGSDESPDQRTIRPHAGEADVPGGRRADQGGRERERRGAEERPRSRRSTG